MSFVLQRKGDSDTVDINTLMFVCLHEMSLLWPPSIGHGTELLNFKFILEEAQSIGIYDPQNYKKSQLSTAPWKSTPRRSLSKTTVSAFVQPCMYYKDVLYNSKH
jgi:hypothetical protein